MAQNSFYFDINGSKVEFVHVPKCGGTSTKLMCLEAAGVDWKSTPGAEWDVKFSERKNSQRDFHIWRRGLQTNKWQGSPPDYKFTIIRDPVERLKSAFTNRVLFYNFTKQKTWDEFVEKWPSVHHSDISHHTRPICSWLGRNPSAYTHVFTLDQMDEVAELLSTISGKKIATMKRQDGGSEHKKYIRVTEKHLKKIQDYYKDDYKYWYNESVVPHKFKKEI
jgi:hypothetical protein